MTVNPAQNNMLKQQLRTGDVLDERILDLCQATPRERFVPRIYKQFAYSDYRIPIGHQQKMLTPLEEATVLQALQLQSHETVLEVGTGCGYLTALLCKCAKHVTTVEYFAELKKSAEHNLQQLGIDNVTLHQGDGSRGWMENAPYDVIVISTAMKELPNVFKPQLMKQGKLFAILGEHWSMHGSLFCLGEKERWTETRLFETCVAPVVIPSPVDDFEF